MNRYIAREPCLRQHSGDESKVSAGRGKVSSASVNETNDSSRIDLGRQCLMHENQIPRVRHPHGCSPVMKQMPAFPKSPRAPCTYNTPSPASSVHSDVRSMSRPVVLHIPPPSVIRQPAVLNSCSLESPLTSTYPQHLPTLGVTANACFRQLPFNMDRCCPQQYSPMPRRDQQQQQQMDFYPDNRVGVLPPAPPPTLESKSDLGDYMANERMNAFMEQRNSCESQRKQLRSNLFASMDSAVREKTLNENRPIPFHQFMVPGAAALPSPVAQRHQITPEELWAFHQLNSQRMHQFKQYEQVRPRVQCQVLRSNCQSYNQEGSVSNVVSPAHEDRGNEGRKNLMQTFPSLPLVGAPIMFSPANHHQPPPRTCQEHSRHNIMYARGPNTCLNPSPHFSQAPPYLNRGELYCYQHQRCPPFHRGIPSPQSFGCYNQMSPYPSVNRLSNALYHMGGTSDGTSNTTTSLPDFAILQQAAKQH